MPKGRLMVCPATVRVIVHEPIPTAGPDARRRARARRARAGGRRVRRRRLGLVSLSMDLIVASDVAAIVRPAWAVAEPVRRRRARSADWTSRCVRARRRCALAAESAEITAAVRTMYKRVGLDPTKTRPSSEALLRRVRKGDELPRINSLVDVINWCSLESQLPFGLYDLDHIRRRRHAAARRGRARSTPGIRKDAVHVAGRLTLADDARPVRQSDVGFGAHDGDAGDDARAGRDLRARRRWRRPSASARSRSRRRRIAQYCVRACRPDEPIESLRCPSA